MIIEKSKQNGDKKVYIGSIFQLAMSRVTFDY